MKRLIFAFIGTIAAASPACKEGGCPWTKTSAVTITPPTSCLNVTVGPASADCVDPRLFIQNTCADTLVVQGGSIIGGADAGVVADDAGGISIPPATTGEVELTGHGAGAYVVSATLGTQSIEMDFSATN